MLTKNSIPVFVGTRLGVLCTLVLLSGCGGSGNDTYPLTGNVTYKDKAVPVGRITLTPDESKGNKGPMGFATIKDGVFTTEEGKGVVGGPYKLQIEGYTGIPIKGGEGGMDPNGAPLFRSYEMTVEIPAEDTPLEIKVPVRTPRRRTE